MCMVIAYGNYHVLYCFDEYCIWKKRFAVQRCMLMINGCWYLNFDLFFSMIMFSNDGTNLFILVIKKLSIKKMIMWEWLNISLNYSEKKSNIPIKFVRKYIFKQYWLIKISWKWICKTLLLYLLEYVTHKNNFHKITWENDGHC